MADGDYERRSTKEAELGRLTRIIAEARLKCYNSKEQSKQSRKETNHEEGIDNRNHWTGRKLSR